MAYKVIKRCGQIAIEKFENENVIITRWTNGDIETEFKPNCDPKVKDMWNKLNEPIRR